MPFVKVSKSRFNAGALESVVTMGAYLADGKLHKSKSVAFRMTRGLITELGWKPGVDYSLRLNVLEGTGTDSGFVQIVNDLDSSMVNGFRVSLGPPGSEKSLQGISLSVTADRLKHYVLNECPVSSHRVTHLIEQGALIIECPDWLRYNPASYTEPEPDPLPVKDTVVEMKRERQMNRQERRMIGNKVARMLK